MTSYPAWLWDILAWMSAPKFFYSRLNTGRIIRLCSAAAVFAHFLQYVIAFYSRPEAASDVMSSAFPRLIVPDKCLKVRDPRLDRSGEISPEAVGCVILDGLFATTSDRK